jgi:hypothetical protein
VGELQLPVLELRPGPPMAASPARPAAEGVAVAGPARPRAVRTTGTGRRPRAQAAGVVQAHRAPGAVAQAPHKALGAVAPAPGRALGAVARVRQRAAEAVAQVPRTAARPAVQVPRMVGARMGEPVRRRPAGLEEEEAAGLPGPTTTARGGPPALRSSSHPRTGPPARSTLDRQRAQARGQQGCPTTPSHLP